MIKIFIFLVVFLQHYSQQVQAECRTTTTLAPAEQFDLFQKMFNVKYENATVAAQKFAIFNANIDKIAQINAAAAAANLSYKLEVNKFADLVSTKFLIVKKLF